MLGRLYDYARCSANDRRVYHADRGLTVGRPVVSTPLRMSARGATANTILPFSLRWIVVPALGWAVFAPASSYLRRRRQLSLAPMSDEWLRANEADLGRRWDL